MKKKNKKNKSGASATSEATSSVVANARLVTALKGYDQSREQAKTYLVEVGTIVLQEQLTKAEVVASIVEARGCTEKTANEQYSRMKKIINSEENLELLRTGEADLKTVRENTTKTQKNPSKKKAKENAEKRFATGGSAIVKAAKELGYDMATVLNTIKAALKKAGVK